MVVDFTFFISITSLKKWYYQCKACKMRFLRQEDKNKNPLRHSKTLTKEYLQSAYVEKQKSTVEVARDTGTCPRTVAGYLLRYGIPAHERGRIYKKIENVEGFMWANSDWHTYWLGFIAAD